MLPVHESTLALSVYNALLRVGSLTLDQVLTHLRANWAPEMVAEEVEIGVSYLRNRGLVALENATLHVSHLRGGVARPIKRREDMPTELVLA